VYCVSVLSNAASDVLNHLDLIACPPDVVIGALHVRLRRLNSHRVSLRAPSFAAHMAQEDASGEMCHGRLGGDAHEMNHRGPHNPRVVRYGGVGYMRIVHRVTRGNIFLLLHLKWKNLFGGGSD
jgi:hypothetical protein